MARTPYWSTRPIKHPEREEVIGFLASHDVGTLNAPVTAQYDAVYRDVEARYVSALAANHETVVAARTTGERLAVAVAAFVAAFWGWLRFAEATAGKRLASWLAPVLGGKTPHAFVGQSVPSKIRWVERLFEQIDQVPSLVGDPAAHAALRDAAAAMAIARRENDTALTARAAAVRSLNDATAEFDRQYGALVRLILLTDPDGIGARLPRFRRGGTSVAPAAGQAAAPPPAPSPEPEADPADAPTPEGDDGAPVA